MRDFNEFKANGNIFSYAIAGKYVIVCPTYVYETDKYLKYIDENNLRDTYVRAISSPCYNEAVKIKLGKEHGNVPTQTLEEGLFMN